MNQDQKINEHQLTEYQKTYSILKPTKERNILCREPKCLHYNTYEGKNNKHIFKCTNVECKYKGITFYLEDHICEKPIS